MTKIKVNVISPNMRALRIRQMPAWWALGRRKYFYPSQAILFHLGKAVVKDVLMSKFL